MRRPGGILTCLFTAVLTAAALTLPAQAEKLAFEITTDQPRINVGGSLQLNLIFRGTQSISAPRIPDINGFKVNYLGPATRMSIVNGQISTSITHMYRIFATNTGKFQIGPFEIDYEGQTLRSNALVVDVLGEGSVVRPSSQAPSQAPYTQSQNQSDLGDKAYMTMEVDKKTVFVNESMTLKIKLYVHNLSMRDITYPDFNHEGFSVTEFGKPDQKPEVQHGMSYEVLEFSAPIFPVKPGDLKIGPAEIKGTVIAQMANRVKRSIFDEDADQDVFSDFFGGFQSFPLTLTSNAVDVKVLPIPDAGKPDTYQGAVGTYSLDVQAQPSKIKLGDPVNLKMTVKGSGNINTVTAPLISVNEDEFKTYEPQVTKQENDSKTFEQVIIPKKQGPALIPKVALSYFDPSSRSYKTIEKGPFPIEVLKSEVDQSMKVVETPKTGAEPETQEVFGRDIIYIKSSLGRTVPAGKYLFQKGWFIILQIIPVFMLGLAFVAERYTSRLRTDISYARGVRASRKARQSVQKVQRALSQGAGGKFYDNVFKVLQDYLGDKFNLPPGAVTADVIAGLLKEKNADELVTKKLVDIFAECDMARYAPAGIDSQKTRQTFESVKEVIDYLEHIRI